MSFVPYSEDGRIFKQLAAKEGKPMNELFHEILAEYLKEHPL